MNFLLATIGTSGDVYPFIAIGQELQRRGHRATLVANEYFEPAAQQAGLHFISLANRQRYLDTLQKPELWDPKKGVQVLADAVFASMEDTYRIISEADHRDTRVIASGLMFGARIAQERLGIPLTTVHLQPAMLWSYEAPPVMAALPFPRWFPAVAKRPILKLVDRAVLDKVLGPRTNAFRAQLGLQPVRSLYSRWLRSPERVIGIFPDWFAEPQSDWPAQTSLTGFIRGPVSHQSNTLPADLESFLSDGEAPVVFTAGTGMLHAKEFFVESIKACELAGLRGVLVTPFGEQLPNDLPKFMHHCEHAAFGELFPRAAAVVHHGGIGTIAEAIAAGKPQLIRPTSHDQPDNAARLEKLGLSATIPAPQYQAQHAARALSALLADATLGERCRLYSGRVDFDHSLASVCDLLVAG
ncbi:glycosyltransferase [Thiobacillus denitrificans]|uniref:glycosyltransferase n=1 Tax=Thiobacillus denitrificans TaxID=36861 RepID=UPI00036919E7|nr:glycosyltransferase [Thiobacillus denitrificans]